MPVVVLVSRSSTATVPDSTLNSETWPTNWSATRPEDVGQRLAGRVGRRHRPTLRSPALTATGRSAGDGPSSQMKSARRSMPTPVIAEPTSDRELAAVEDLVGQRALQLGGRRHVAGQVALELLVVAGHDLLDQLVVQPVLLVGDVGPAAAPCGGARRGSYSKPWSVSTSATPWNASSSPSGSSSGTKPAPNAARRASSTRWKSARGLSSLLTNTSRGMPVVGAAAHASSVPTSTPSTALTTITARSATDEGGVDVTGEVGVPGRVDQVDLVGLAVGGRPLERRERRATATSCA